jgi:hypothetical protein
MPDVATQNLLDTLGQTAYSLFDNPATLRYREEMRAIGRGFRRLIHDNPLDEETLLAIKALHVEHPDPMIALCRAFQRAVSFNYDPVWNEDLKFDADRQHIWPVDGSEWKSNHDCNAEVA